MIVGLLQVLDLEGGRLEGDSETGLNKKYTEFVFLVEGPYATKNTT